MPPNTHCLSITLPALYLVAKHTLIHFNGPSLDHKYTMLIKSSGNHHLQVEAQTVGEAHWGRLVPHEPVHEQGLEA